MSGASKITNFEHPITAPARSIPRPTFPSSHATGTWQSSLIRRSSRRSTVYGSLLARYGPPDMDCPTCGFPLNPSQQEACPKCDNNIAGSASMGVLEVDVVHSGETWQEAAGKIEHALDQGLQWGHKGVKIIHGHGANTGRSIIAPRAIALMRHLAERTGGRFSKDRQNPGASIVWLNR